MNLPSSSPTLLFWFLFIVTCFYSCHGFYIEKSGTQGVKYIISRYSENADRFGAKANRRKDDNEGFLNTWNKACSSEGDVAIVVPRSTYTLKPITFSGPCKSNITFQIYGTIKAPADIGDYEHRNQWIEFLNLESFRVEGGGTIDGNGKIWWRETCKIKKSQPCISSAPTAMTFRECKNFEVVNLNFINAQQMHLRFDKCENVRAMSLSVTAPGRSPNTDGIHISATQNISLEDCVVGTGDDCISIVSGSEYVRATNITCGPGHGISIGSLGAGHEDAKVSNVFVDGATFSGTSNGVRIKTWQGGSGFAKDILFQNIKVHKVHNPIIIDQNYCDRKEACEEQPSAVEISNVMYRNIVGNSASEVGVNLQCSKTIPCRGIFMENIDLTSQKDGESAKASCHNVDLEKIGKVLISSKHESLGSQSIILLSFFVAINYKFSILGIYHEIDQLTNSYLTKPGHLDCQSFATGLSSSSEQYCIYRNIVGTSSSEVGVTFNCSKNKEFCCITLLCSAKKPAPKPPAIM
ncbi:hypothetical protein K2173_012404 [Erythroxylum novogranatense]|uniref:endo-polygalacturonase n=1 Tax=Erythroxylum novogranatense TaxID=1862640 RepID=A0AAV8UDN9_9ROSI|nr:hypothetical protein K2173_012404 [Erythroxylum novogranatense]